MPGSWIVESIDVFEDGYLGIAARVPEALPKQFYLGRLEEGFQPLRYHNSCQSHSSTAPAVHVYMHERGAP